MKRSLWHEIFSSQWQCTTAILHSDEWRSKNWFKFRGLL